MKENKPVDLVPWIQKDSGEEFVPFEGVKKDSDHALFYGNPYPVIWKPNTDFKAAMRVKNIRGNNYEAVINLTDVTTGVDYRIESFEFVRILNTSSVVLGNIIGLWKFKKSGRYYYLIFEGPINKDELYANDNTAEDSL